MRCTMPRRKEREGDGAQYNTIQFASVPCQWCKEPEQSRLHVKLHVKEDFFVVVASKPPGVQRAVRPIVAQGRNQVVER